MEPSKKERKENVNRDLLATFTFVLSGILFYTIGQGAEAGNLESNRQECYDSQAILVVEDGVSETPAELSLLVEGRLDS